MRISVYDVLDFIRPKIDCSNMLPISYDEVGDAFEDGYGLTAEARSMTVGYVMVKELAECFKVGPVVVDPDYSGNGLGVWLIERLAKEFGGLQKPLVVIVNLKSCNLFLQNGFMPGDKRKVPVCLRGGRTEKEWLDCDRQYMYYKKDPFGAIRT